MNNNFDEVLRHQNSEQNLFTAFKKYYDQEVKAPKDPPQLGWEFLLENISLQLSNFSMFLYLTWGAMFMRPRPNVWEMSAPSEQVNPSDSRKHFYFWLELAVNNMPKELKDSERMQALRTRLMTGTKLINLLLGNFYPAISSSRFYSYLNQCIGALLRHDREAAVEAFKSLCNIAILLSGELMKAEGEYNRKVADFIRDQPTQNVRMAVSHLGLPFGDYYAYCGGRTEEMRLEKEKTHAMSLKQRDYFMDLYRYCDYSIDKTRNLVELSLADEHAAEELKTGMRNVLAILDDPIKMAEFDEIARKEQSEAVGNVIIVAPNLSDFPTTLDPKPDADTDPDPDHNPANMEDETIGRFEIHYHDKRGPVIIVRGTKSQKREEYLFKNFKHGFWTIVRLIRETKIKESPGIRSTEINRGDFQTGEYKRFKDAYIGRPYKHTDGYYYWHIVI